MSKRLGTWKLFPSLLLMGPLSLISIMTWIFFLLIPFHSLCFYSSHKSLEREAQKSFSSFCSFKWFGFFSCLFYMWIGKKGKKESTKENSLNPPLLSHKTDTFPCFFIFSFLSNQASSIQFSFSLAMYTEKFLFRTLKLFKALSLFCHNTHLCSVHI